MSQHSGFSLTSSSSTTQTAQEDRPSSGSSAVLLSKWAKNNKSLFKRVSAGENGGPLFQRVYAGGSSGQKSKEEQDVTATSTTKRQWDNAYSTIPRTNSRAAGFDVGPAADLSNIHSKQIEFSNSAMKSLGYYEDLPFTNATSSEKDSQCGDYDSDIESVSTIKEAEESSSRPVQSNLSQNSPQNRHSTQDTVTSLAANPFSPGYFTQAMSSNATRPQQQADENNEKQLQLRNVENITDSEKSQLLTNKNGGRRDSEYSRLNVSFYLYRLGDWE